MRRRAILYAAFLLLLLPLQTLGPLTYLPSRPDLAFVVVFWTGLFFGPVAGALLGMACGLLLDLYSWGTIGVNLLLKPCVGLAAGLLGLLFAEIGVGLALVLALGMTIGQELIAALVMRVVSFENLTRAFFAAALLRALWTTLLAWGCTALLLARRLERMGVARD